MSFSPGASSGCIRTRELTIMSIFENYFNIFLTQNGKMNMLNTNLTLLKQNTGFVNKHFVTRKISFTKITELLYYYEHSAHIFFIENDAEILSVHYIGR